jgi:hypothetical protein
MIKKLPQLILWAAIILSAVAGVLVCIFAIPPFGTAIAKNYPDYAFWQYPILVGLYAGMLCYFFALFHFWLLLNSVDKYQILPANNLKAIRLSTIALGILYYLSALPVIYLYAEADDAPGLILIGAFFGIFPICVAAFAAILERITEK